MAATIGVGRRGDMIGSGDLDDVTERTQPRHHEHAELQARKECGPGTQEWSGEHGIRSTPRQWCFHTIRHMAEIPRRNAMTNHPRYQNTARGRRVDPVTAFAHEPCQITHARATSCGRSTG